MNFVALDRIVLFVAFIGGLWIADIFSDHDGNATLMSIVWYGIAAIFIGFVIDLIRHRFCK